MSLMATALVAPIAGASTAPRIVATTPLLADCAQRLCGAPATALIPPGTHVQSYRPSRADAALLAQADLVLWHGPQVETELASHLARQPQNRPAVTLGTADRWPELLPAHRAETVAALAAALAAQLPQLAISSAEQATRLADELSALDARCAALLAEVAQDRRLLVTASPALTAFGTTYGLATVEIPTTETARRTLLTRMAARGNSIVFTIADPADDAAQTFATMAPGLRLVHLPLTMPAAGQPDLAEQTAASLALHLSSPPTA